MPQTTDFDPAAECPPTVLGVFPGIGSPKTKAYSPVYDLLAALALRRGYQRVDVVTWPGQTEGDDERLSFPAALAKARDWVHSQEHGGTGFDILGRSFGTLVAMNIAVEDRPRFLNRLMCWGPSPFSTYWAYFVRNQAQTVASSLAKGTRIDPDLFVELIPMEILAAENEYPVRFVRGDRDELCPEAFFRLLQSACEGRRTVSFGVVSGAAHEVKSSDPAQVRLDYETALFSTGRD